MSGAERRSTTSYRGAGVLAAVGASLVLHFVATQLGDALPERPEPERPNATASDGEIEIEPWPEALRPVEEPPPPPPPEAQPEEKPEPEARADAAAAPEIPDPLRDPETEPSAEVDPEVAPPEPAPPTPPEATPPEPTPPSSPEPPAAPAEPPPVAVNPGSPDLPAPGAPGEYDLPPGAEGAAGVPGMPGLPGVGMPGAAPVWTLPGAVSVPQSLPAPTRAPAAAFDPKAATKALGGTLQTSDKEKGVNLPAAGTVVSALGTAVQATPAPHNARATFEVKLSPSGQVIGARVVKASAGDPAMWDAALKRAQAQIAAKGLAMTGEAAKSGATVRVSVLTRHVYPTGTGKKLELKPQCANGIINELAVATRKKADQAVDDPNAIPPEVEGANPFVDANGLPCIPVGIGGTADLANIGAHRQLQVQTQFDVELDGARALPSTVQKINKDAPWLPSAKEGPRANDPYAVRKREQKRQKKK